MSHEGVQKYFQIECPMPVSRSIFRLNVQENYVEAVGLNTIEHYWTLSNTIEHNWTLLNTIEYYWTLLNTIERLETLLNIIEH